MPLNQEQHFELLPDMRNYTVQIARYASGNFRVRMYRDDECMDVMVVTPDELADVVENWTCEGRPA